MVLLNNEEVENLAAQAIDQATALEELFYTQFKSADVLTKTTSFRGAAADNYKQYIQLSTIHHINMFINIVGEIKTAIEEVKSIYLGFESDTSGKVDTADLETADQKVSTEQNDVAHITERVETLNNQAAEYIPITDIQSTSLDTDFQAIRVFFSETTTNFTDTDTDALRKAEGIYDRIQELKTSIHNINENYYDSQGAIALDRVGNIANESWYTQEPTTTLMAKIDEDPYHYGAGTDAVSEGQWATGYATDTYAMAGYSTLGYGYETSVNNGVYSASGEAAVFDGSASAEFAGLAEANAAGRVAYANGTAEFGSLTGDSDKSGVHLAGNVGVGEATADIRVGNDIIGGEAEASADFLTADGKASLMVEDQNNYSVGIQARASAAEVSASAGTSLFSVEVAQGEGENKVKDKVDLLAFDIEGHAGLGAGVTAYAETQNVGEWGPVNFNATSIDLGGKLGLGITLGISIPTITFDTPW